MTAPALSAVARPGKVSGDYDLFLKQFSGEVLTTFETQCKLKDLGVTKTITHGQSAQFPFMGRVDAKFHTVGDNIIDPAASYLQSVVMGEKVIQVDNLLTASMVIPRIDELENHYDVRQYYVKELAGALARKHDNFVARTACLAAYLPDSTHGSGTANSIAAGAGSARPANIPGVTGTGTILVNNVACTAATFATTFISKLFSMAMQFDKNNVPEEGRYCIISPNAFYGLTNQLDTANAGPGWLFDRDTNPDPANANKRRIPEIAGFKIYVSNNSGTVGNGSATVGVNYTIATSGTTSLLDAPTGGNNLVSLAAGSGGGTSALANAYGANMNQVMAICGQTGAFGTLKLVDLTVESEYKMELQGTLFIAKYAMGHNVLRPECAGLIVLS